MTKEKQETCNKMKTEKEGMNHSEKGKNHEELMIPMKYEDVKSKLMMQIMHTERNRDLLDRVPHREWEDLSIVYRIGVQKDADELASVLVTEEIRSALGVTAAHLHRDALATAPQFLPAKVTGMRQFLLEGMQDLQSETEEAEEMLFPDVYILNTEPPVFGGACIFYPGFMKMVTELLDNSCYILPCSMHELMAVPDDGTIELAALQNIVAEVNATSVSEEDYLSDSIYYCEKGGEIMFRCNDRR